MLKESDLEPLRALIFEIEQARIGAGWHMDEDGEPVEHEVTVEELAGSLLNLYWLGRNVYDELAAKVEGARSYAEAMDEAPEVPDRPSGPDDPF